MTQFLLDTHIWLWSALDQSRLSKRVIAALENPDSQLWLSPISLWEVLTLCEKNRLALYPAPQSWIASTLNLTPMREAQVTYQVAQETARVHLPHRDPADRLLVATARVFDLTLITADEKLLHARQVAVLANR